MVGGRKNQRLLLAPTDQPKQRAMQSHVRHWFRSGDVRDLVLAVDIEINLSCPRSVCFDDTPLIMDLRLHRLRKQSVYVVE